uniref:Uncharacterized protein n=1 Tax=Siphoviridae sp. ctL0q1 TaxID=2825449 RepID=A0A8S5PJS6_9CAUD|nr:MAG TPA: hypothetical protein [Siphoviridae sp. ctL0q1]
MMKLIYPFISKMRLHKVYTRYFRFFYGTSL